MTGLGRRLFGNWIDRTASFRDLAGALIGGFFGILAAGYFAEWACYPGALIGVIVGYYFSELPLLCRSASTKAQRFGEDLRYHFEGMRQPKRPLSDNERVQRNIWWARCSVWIILGSIHLALIALPIYWTYRALQAHAAEDCPVITFTALVGFVLTLVAGFALHYLHSEMEKEIDRRSGPNCWLGYSRTEEWKAGPLRFIGRRIGITLYTEIVIVAVLAAALLFWAGLGSLWITVLVVPMATLILIGKAVWQLMCGTGHWLCLTVVMTVTGITAHLLMPWFDNRILLWCVAFANAALCAGVALAARRVVSMLPVFDLLADWFDGSLPNLMENGLSPIFSSWSRMWEKFKEGMDRIPNLV